MMSWVISRSLLRKFPFTYIEIEVVHPSRKSHGEKAELAKCRDLSAILEASDMDHGTGPLILFDVVSDYSQDVDHRPCEEVGTGLRLSTCHIRQQFALCQGCNRRMPAIPALSPRQRNWVSWIEPVGAVCHPSHKFSGEITNARSKTPTKRLRSRLSPGIS